MVTHKYAHTHTLREIGVFWWIFRIANVAHPSEKEHRPATNWSQCIAHFIILQNCIVIWFWSQNNNNNIKHKLHISCIHRIYEWNLRVNRSYINSIELILFSLKIETKKKKKKGKHVTSNVMRKKTIAIHIALYTYIHIWVIIVENFHQMMQDQEESNSFISHMPKLDWIGSIWKWFNKRYTMRNTLLGITELEKEKKSKSLHSTLDVHVHLCLYLILPRAISLSLLLDVCADFFQSHWMCLTNVLKIVNRFS